eukprot:7505206-Karenia_brevis.AAC.1
MANGGIATARLAQSRPAVDDEDMADVAVDNAPMRDAGASSDTQREPLSRVGGAAEEALPRKCA